MDTNDKTVAAPKPAPTVATKPQPATEDNSKFLKDSGCVFIVLGVIALIVGLIIAETAIWISGATAIASGVYCLIKGKEQAGK